MADERYLIIIIIAIIVTIMFILFLTITKISYNLLINFLTKSNPHHINITLSSTLIR